MTTTRLTHLDSFALTLASPATIGPSGEVVVGAAQLVGEGVTPAAVEAAQQAADDAQADATQAIADAAAAQAGANASLKIASNLGDLQNAATARTNLGATATGVSLFTAASPAVARNAIGANQKSLDGRILSLAAAGAEVVYVPWTGGASGFLTELTVVLAGPLAVGDATVALAINGTPTVPPALTLTQAGSAAGSRFTMAITDANAVAANAVVTLTVGGANTAVVGAGFSVGAIY